MAYSSGENETLSIPFIKSRFIHLHEFREDIINDVVDYSLPENSLIYIDANMSQAILLSCLLFEDPMTLKSLADLSSTGILKVKNSVCVYVKRLLLMIIILYIPILNYSSVGSVFQWCFRKRTI